MSLIPAQFYKVKHMTEISLSDYVQGEGQASAAAILKVSQGSISKMLKRQRDIRFLFDSKNNFLRAYEVKPLSNVENAESGDIVAA